MKNKINLVLLFSLSLLLTNCTTSKQLAEKDTKTFRYEIEQVKTGTQGNYLVKVWSYSKDPQVALDQAKKNAVHGILFKGLASKEGVPMQKALIGDSNLVNSRSDFFDPFFADGGAFLKYVSLTNDGNVLAGDRVRVGKEYKIAVIVSVHTAELRKLLEQQNIIKTLDSGF